MGAKNAVSGVFYAFGVGARSTGLNEKPRKHWHVAGLSFLLKNVLLEILGGDAGIRTLDPGFAQMRP